MGLVYLKNIKGDVVSYGNDPLNTEGSRNINNTNSSEYNCGGWALNIFEWLVPFLSCGNIDNFSDFAYLYDEQLNDFHDYFYDEENCESLKNEINSEIKEHNGDAGKQYYAHWDDETIINLSIQHLLSAFKDMRLISSFDELKEDEYGIIFATNESDFHFARVFNGVITAKCGGLRVKEYESIDDAMSCYPFGRTYFARKIQEGMDSNYRRRRIVSKCDE